MYRAKHLIGLPVVNVATGERVASVRSLLIDLMQGQLLGLVVQRSTIFREAQALLLEQLHAIGEDAVLVKEGQKTLALPDLLAKLPRARTEDKLFGRQVLTSSGKVVGALEDIYFDPQDGTISHYLLADGLLQSLLTGLAMLPAPAQSVVGEEHVIISDVGQEQMEQQLTLGIEPPDLL